MQNPYEWSRWYSQVRKFQRHMPNDSRRAYAAFYTKFKASYLLAGLAVERCDESVVDPACGTGSLLLASLAWRWALSKRSGGCTLSEILKKTIGFDVVKPATRLTELLLTAVTCFSERPRVYALELGGGRAGSLDLLINHSVLSPEVERFAEEKFDVVLMNPPFTRSDRVPLIIDGEARKAIVEVGLSFGGVTLRDIFEAGLAKPFMALADFLVKDGGRIAVVLPGSVLSRESWRDVREGIARGYSMEYLVVSWAPGSPNFSDDTGLREVLAVLRKGGSADGVLKVIGLYRDVDELSFEEVEAIVDSAKTREMCGDVVYNGRAVANITCIRHEEVKRLSDNLYRLIAFKNGELLKWHLELLSNCKTVKFGELFDVGSVIDHTKGLAVCRREVCPRNLQYATPAMWGSGNELGVRSPIIANVPYILYAKDGDVASRVAKYWKRVDAYTSNLFILRRGRLNTQYVLMASTREVAVSNVWWPLRAKTDPKLYLTLFNSSFGFIHLLGERLETEGLYVEYKKGRLADMPVPDLRNTNVIDVDQILTQNMTKFDDYVNYMKRVQEGMKESWYAVARHVSQMGNEHSPRAELDVVAYDALKQVCKNVEPPERLYELLYDEIETLKGLSLGRT